MGAHQSSPHQTASAAATKACYYELLGVERRATDHEIKQAYRRRALELHPDRNINDVETATRKFAEVQAAYEVLSDAQERAWYDSHRDAILGGQDHPGDGAEPTTFRNVRLTTTEEILSLMRKFNVAVPFDDEPTGFFGIARETFEHLALEEEAAAEFEDRGCPDYPTFGSSSSSYDAVVKLFYAAWAGFSTNKSFSWKDKYRLSDAPDRRVRRLMDKENKKSRDDAAREFNDAVRFLVSFVRKRDPRYLPNNQTEAERQKSLRDAAAAQAARSRAANQEKMASYHVPDWAGSRDHDTREHAFSEPDEESEIELLECVVCNKTFKSVKQLEAHERSKKHVKTIQQLRRQMRKEGADLELDVAVSPAPNSHQGVEPASPQSVDPVEDDEEGRGISNQEPAPATNDQESDSSQESALMSDSDDYVPRSVVEERLTPSPGGGGQTNDTAPNEADDKLSARTQDMAIDNDTMRRAKVGKAKAKRERKAAALRSAEDDTEVP
ncbi:DnaJ subfamily C member 21 [Tolypocladium capitatum]|uniref:DnaJ subfamily C member 21 n=1 Tax=Tolypocladium capitatum TaxID=45235 RepID=A0A2K3QPZ7_9HYPO|nr:DnaJ subfamily C member 21 [Tolypocladium capitatum]